MNESQEVKKNLPHIVQKLVEVAQCICEWPSIQPSRCYGEEVWVGASIGCLAFQNNASAGRKGVF